MTDTVREGTHIAAALVFGGGVDGAIDAEPISGNGPASGGISGVIMAFVVASLNNSSGCLVGLAGAT